MAAWPFIDATDHIFSRTPAPTENRSHSPTPAVGQPIAGLYCVGEAAGFGGGGASGKRSLEGSFLPGCILTARAAARSIHGSRSG